VNSWESILLAIIGAVGLDRLLIYLDQRRAQRRKAEAEADQTGASARKTDAEADDIQANAWEKAFANLERSLTGQIKFQEKRITELTQDVNELKCALTEAYNRIVYLMDGIRKLINQIYQARQTPVWTPTEWQPIASDAFHPVIPPARPEPQDGAEGISK